jgi:hypothetical protein
VAAFHEFERDVMRERTMWREDPKSGDRSRVPFASPGGTEVKAIAATGRAVPVVLAALLGVVAGLGALLGAAKIAGRRCSCWPGFSLERVVGRTART